MAIHHDASRFGPASASSLDAIERTRSPTKVGLRVLATARWAAAGALIAMAAFVGYQIALQGGTARLREAAEHRLDMLVTSLDADLARFDYLPALLEMTPVVPALLDAPSESGLRDAVNRYLSGVNATAGAEMLYVLDPKGTSLAASDWQQPGTTIGQDLSFRPYVSGAIAEGRGRFFGVGITSGKPGYYLSYALGRGSQTRGLVAVKVSIEGAERGWQKLPGNVVVIDERGVVILSTRKDLKYRPVAPLTPAQVADVRRFRPYGDASLEPLRWPLAEGAAADTRVVELDGLPQLATTRALQHAPWRLVVLDDLAPVRTLARYAAFTAALAMAVLLLLMLAFWQRQRAIRQKLATQAALQSAHDDLESIVVMRTAQLRATQSELVHAGKMGVLGQMSAGMVHELNQPLTALRTLSVTAAILLDQNRSDEVRGNLTRIGGLVDRLARLTSQLKTFSYKSDVVAVPVPVARCVADAELTVRSEIDEVGATVHVDIRPAELNVLSDEAVLGSMLVNLIRNAVEAMAEAPVRDLRIQARQIAQRVVITVSDTGAGISPDILPRLFEPFVTSKPAGKGLGLGLVISAELARAAGGTLRANNRDEGGASFVIELPTAADHR